MERLKLHIFLLLTLVIFSGCRKERNHPVPSIPFDFQIDLSLPSYQPLTGTGGWAYVNGGLKGIIVYRRSFDEFVAWERQSPTDPEGACSTGLTPNEDNFLQLDDPCSDATFSMYDGSPMANSEWGLRGYRCQWDGSNLLRISN